MEVRGSATVTRKRSVFHPPGKGSPLIRSMRVRNFLSFSDNTELFQLRPLNVFIGPNGSGKSNFLDVIELFRATSMDLPKFVRECGGTNNLLWKGTRETPVAEIDAILDYPDGPMSLRHRLSFTVLDQRFELVDEVIENEEPLGEYQEDVYFFYRHQRGHPVLNVRAVEGQDMDPTRGAPRRKLQPETLDTTISVLSQRHDPDYYPELSYLFDHYRGFLPFREWSTGRNTQTRRPQGTDLPVDMLLPDGSNLAPVLNAMQHQPGGWDDLQKRLHEFHEPFIDLSFRVESGTIQVYFRERGLSQPIPATRLSDGTLRYLCLLAVLCHPTPPPVVCIEEPELGLHPDILPSVAEMLVEASQRTQLFVTTHSEVLVDALTETPEAVVVCEKEEGATVMHRLSKDELSHWLKEYSLGQLWSEGEIGGNRW